MPRNSSTIPDEPSGKQMMHYVNGRDHTDGMHPGIRSKCSICAVLSLIECEKAPGGIHSYGLDLRERNGKSYLQSVCIWCGNEPEIEGAI